MGNKDFTDMNVWKLGFNLIKKIYGVTKNLPIEERYGLISDMRRSVNSISNNNAEGFGRFEVRDKTRFCKISRGSCYELHNQLLIYKELEYIPNDNFTFEKIKDNKSIITELNKVIKIL